MRPRSSVPRQASAMSERHTLVLTGASRGIGHATVKRFGEAGWRVITCSREDVPADCRRDPAWSHHITADLSDAQSLAHFVDAALAALGDDGLNALVNNARVSPKTPIKERLGGLHRHLHAL